MRGSNLLSAFAITGYVFLFAFSISGATAQNISSGEPVQVVGSFNGYSTTPYGSDYRTSSYRRVSITTGNPTDGRGQWATTIAVPGNVAATNMAGGSGNGFLFISGPSGNRFMNKWVFSNVGQGALDAINNNTAYNSGQDMGLNMSASGYYTFVMNDCGYTLTNARYYVGYTSASPVDITSVGATPQVGGTALISVTTSATPSSEEKIYVRYTTGTDFTTSTGLVQVSMAGTNGTATIPGYPVGQTVRYYVFSSTRTLAQLNGDSEGNRSLATLRYNDNSGNNYTYAALPVTLTSFTGEIKNRSIQLAWATATEFNNAYFDIQRSADSRQWHTIGSVAGNGTSLQAHTYSFTDDAPLSGLNFYRLVQTDRDGKTNYSPIIRIKMDVTGEVLVFPNPVIHDEIFLEFSEHQEETTARLYDSQGTLLREWPVTAESHAPVRLALSGIPGGRHFLWVNGKGYQVLSPKS